MSYRRQRKKIQVYAIQIVSPKGNIITWTSPGAIENIALEWAQDPSKDNLRFVGIDKAGYSVGEWSTAEVLAGWFAKDVL